MRSIILGSYILCALFTLHAQQDFKIVESTTQKVVVSYSPVYLDTTYKAIDGNDYRIVQILNGEFLHAEKSGYPQIPSRSFQIGVPDNKGNRITIRSISTKEIIGTVLPFPKMVKNLANEKQSFIKSDVYNSSNVFPGSIIYENGSGSVRNLPVITVTINAARYNPKESKITLITNVEFEITFPKINLTSHAVADQFLSDVVINGNAAQNFITTKQAKVKTGSTSSVLATGKWVRFEAKTEGMYQITSSMFASLGIPSDVDMSTIKIFNNGGKVLSETVSDDRPNDLVENAIYVSNDTILFYGHGVNFWDYDQNSGIVKRFSSPYSDQNYYWLTYGGAKGKRIQLQNSLSVSNALIDTTTSAFAYREDELINIGKSGRDFLGDAFTETGKTRTYQQTLEGLLPSLGIQYRYRFVNAASTAVSLSISENNNQLINKYISGYGSNSYSYGTEDIGTFSYSGSLPNNTSNLQFTFNASGTSTIGYLDYYEIQYTRNLLAKSDFLTIWSPSNTSENVEYRLTGFTNNSIWVFNVSDYANTKLISNPQRLANGEFRFIATETMDIQSKYIACTPFQFKTPTNITAMSNQDLHGNTVGAKLIIISPPEFLEQANRLKTQRESNSKIAIPTVVVNINDIFNEFSGGNKDVSAIRDYIRYAYVNWPSGNKPEYVLLFGHGDYDYKDKEGSKINYIFPYETTESLNEIDSYNTDDFYARVDGDDDYVDLAIGRLPMQSVSEAKIAIDKIIAYETTSEHSTWRNTITLVADDSYTSAGQTDGSTHTDQSEVLSSYYIPGSYDQNKIYLAAYPTELTSFGRRKPKVNEAIIRAAQDGTLIMNYVGHGSPELWAHEQVFVKDVMIPEFTNSDYFFLTAATCDFGYFDRTSGQSGAEMLILKENGGAIGGFTATRPVYSSLSSALNNEFYNQMFLQRDTLNLPIPIGKAYFLAKKSKKEPNDQKYHLFCDPSLRLNMPQNPAKVDTINNSSANVDVQIKALGKVSIRGTILNPGSSATQNSTYSGEGILTVYDSKQKMPIPEFGTGYTIDIQGGVIYKGRVSVDKGNFAADFVVPKDISYENKNGKIVFYFFNGTEDGLAYSKRIIVGGTDTTTANDKTGPRITISFDKDSLESSFLVRPNATLHVKLEDETGLNTTGSGVGRRLQGVLNQDESNIIDFTNYFVGDLNQGGKSGSILYQFNDLSEGEYRIDVKAWDVFNNASSGTAFFKVVSGNDLVVDYIYNYPNPFSSQTTFLFYHNYSEPVNVKIKIFSIAGRLIQQLEQDGLTERNVKIAWDGRDRDNNQCANGVYLYKLIVSSTDGKVIKPYIGKLSIVHN